ncbi:YbhN family protein [Candidatus Omnitrophota bacterium]
MKKRAMFSFLRVGVSLTLVSALLYAMRDSYPELVRIFKSVNIALFAISLTGFTLAISFTALRLRLLLATQGLLLTLKEIVSLTFIGFFFNNFLPTSIGGDIVKAYYASKKSSRLAAFTSVFVDRFIGLLTMVLMALFALFIARDLIKDKKFIYFIYGFTCLGAGGIVFLTNKNVARRFSFLLNLLGPLKHKLKDFYEVVHRYQRHKGVILKALAISIASQIIYFFSICMLTLSIGTPISIKHVFLRMPIVSAVGLVPSIGGLGIREGAIVILFSPLIGKEAAFALSMLVLTMLFTVSIAGGLIYSFSPQFRLKKEAKG